MSELLQVPIVFKGSWDHLLILTYGADLPFFENALWREIPTRCRNKIILADGNRYLDALESNSHSQLARYLNQRYLFDGIFSTLSAHAKLILLTNAEAGKLLVGSGNLGIQGYASGGELFTQYEYNNENPQNLPAFSCVRDLLEKLGERNYLSQTAIRHIHYLFEKTPWLYSAAVSNWQPVRHNLESSFLDQLEDEIAGEEVEELWVLSPFYDEKAIALRELLKRLAPRVAKLLIQPGCTSVDRKALKSALTEASIPWQVHPIKGRDERADAYIHAKLYLIKTPDRAICLQGSPNLSQVAMLRASSTANLELANLLVGARNQFDNLLEGLDIGPATDELDTLDLTYQPPEPRKTEFEPFLLTNGVWIDDILELKYKGEALDWSKVALMINGIRVAHQLIEQHPGNLKLKIPNQAHELLNSAALLVIQWEEHGSSKSSNPIYLCNRRALDSLLEIVEGNGGLGGIGDLNLEDEELEELLRELDNQLILDDRSIWQLAGKKASSSAGDDEGAVIIDYSDIDFEALKQHPKLKQYQQGGDWYQKSLSRTPLQILLSSIVSHFNDLVDTPTRFAQIETVIKTEEDELDQDVPEEERDRGEEERQRRERSALTRIRQIFKNFIRRYLRGIQSQKFQEIAGFDVMIKNYVIFSHILWRIFSKEWLEPDYIIDAFMKIWEILWGNKDKRGYFDQLGEEEKSLTLSFFGEHKSDCLLLAALYNCAYLTRVNQWAEKLLGLREFWRNILVKRPFTINESTIEGAWIYLGSLYPYEPPTPVQILEELRKLADYETQNSFLRSIEQEFGYPANSCQIKRVKVYRPYLKDTASVDCLEISAPEAIANPETALTILQHWQRVSQLPYYRIASGDGGRLFWYDVEAGEGLFYDKSSDLVEFDSLPLASPLSWEKTLEEVESIAVKMNESLHSQIAPENIKRL